mmetsp:Transcript_2593/g.3536  ORF Transcript_2593/g.3536 Transcript_2593/m.3536 type:complete len:213 (-) Transcript_2593:419-1057(-)
MKKLMKTSEVLKPFVRRGTGVRQGLGVLVKLGFGEARKDFRLPSVVGSVPPVITAQKRLFRPIKFHVATLLCIVCPKPLSRRRCWKGFTAHMRLVMRGEGHYKIQPMRHSQPNFLVNLVTTVPVASSNRVALASLVGLMGPPVPSVGVFAVRVIDVLWRQWLPNHLNALPLYKRKMSPQCIVRQALLTLLALFDLGITRSVEGRLTQQGLTK